VPVTCPARAGHVTGTKWQIFGEMIEVFFEWPEVDGIWVFARGFYKELEQFLLSF